MGLIVTPTNSLISFPIRSNFKEGVNLTEFLLSCYGARKGVIDTAIRTSRAGYLTRRLVDISHFQVISMRDCNTKRGIRVFPLTDMNGKTLVPFAKRRFGRALSNPIQGFGPRNLLINTRLREKARKKYPFALFRSSLLCRAPFFAILRRISFERKIKNKVFLQTSDNIIWKTQKKHLYYTLCQYCYGLSLFD